MKNRKTLCLSCALALLAGGAAAQVPVDYSKYPDYAPPARPDARTAALLQPKADAAKQRPDHVNNAETIYFPPVFNQDGGSCGSASRIAYMFNYEINAYRGLDGSLEENQYPTHFTWLLTNSNSSKDGMAKANGVPNVTTYGGRTYSALFGNQDTASPDFGWMQGYDKWYSAMFNRLEQNPGLPANVGTEEGREMAKNWLWNHNGDTSFKAGGIWGFGVASGGTWVDIPSTDTNDAIGVTGKKYVKAWGAQVDHALTVVGYDDRIEFDLDGNGVAGEKDKDEVGAWIVVNSWGDGWCNNGFIYCPYKNAVTAGNNGNYYTPEVYMIRKDYRPYRTFKITMDYSKRSELRLSGGISTDLTATEPDKSVYFEHFKFAGDGDGDGVDAETPMLGRWADGMHYEPMEFGYDMTDLSNTFDVRKPLKYFFIIETKEGATGEGTVHGLSVIDYEFDRAGIEIPAELGASGVQIANQGQRTVISVVVPGESFNAPRNLTLEGSTLHWTAPMAGSYQVSGYRIYRADTLLAAAPATSLQYDVDDARSSYQVSDLYTYADSVVESARSTASPMPYRGVHPEENYVRMFNSSGFEVADVFDTTYDQATIEYWIRPTSVVSWNQQIGPAWGKFMIHTTNAGELVAGWDTSNRITTAAGSLVKNRWTHVAVVVDGSNLTVYLNGEKAGTLSSSYSGLGGFGNLNVGLPDRANGSVSAALDEFRIWRTARTQTEIQRYMYAEISDPATMPGLLVDLPMSDEADTDLTDVAGGHTVTYYGTQSRLSQSGLLVDNSELAASFALPAEGFTVGVPGEVTNTSSAKSVRWLWNATNSDVQDLAVEHPQITFSQPGEQTVTLTAYDADGNEVKAEQTVNVAAAQAPVASFKVYPATVRAGERVSFINTTANATGCSYSWNMPGADVETSGLTNAGASYSAPGEYEVTLTVSSPQGTSTATHTVVVTAAAPVADFSLSPAAIVKGQKVRFTSQSKFQPTSWMWEVYNTADCVMSLDPNFEVTMDRPGVYNVALKVSNEMGTDRLVRNRALTVCNADGENGLNFYGTGESVEFANPIEENATNFTIDWWMYAKAYGENADQIGSGEDGILIRTHADGSMSFVMNNRTVTTPAHFVSLSEWHHYAVTFSRGTVKMYKDGVEVTSGSVVRPRCPKLPDTWGIGGTAAPMNAVIDEFRVWNTTLTQEKLRSYCNQPIADVAAAEAEDGLALYYQFNQSSGNVADATSYERTGLRQGFGPEGDAWSSSLGIFALDFESGEDVTANYLTNYSCPFLKGEESVNSTNASRFRSLLQNDPTSTWQLTNTVEENGIVTGFHVDGSKGNALTVTTQWDNFSSSLSDHAAFQAVTLPAGFYRFSVEDYSEFASAGSYLVAAEGDGLPLTADLDAQALGYAPMADKEMYFVVDKDKEVSLGLLINMSGLSCLTIDHLRLERLNYRQVNAQGETTGIGQAQTTPDEGLTISVAGGKTVLTVAAPRRVSVYNVAGQLVFDSQVSSSVTLSLPAGVYIVDGRKFIQP